MLSPTRRAHSASTLDTTAPRAVVTPPGAGSTRGWGHTTTRAHTHTHKKTCACWHTSTHRRVETEGGMAHQKLQVLRRLHQHHSDNAFTTQHTGQGACLLQAQARVLQHGVARRQARLLQHEVLLRGLRHRGHAHLLPRLQLGHLNWPAHQGDGRRTGLLRQQQPNRLCALHRVLLEAPGRPHAGGDKGKENGIAGRRTGATDTHTPHARTECEPR